MSPSENILDKYLEAEKYINQGLIRSIVPDTPNKLPRREWMLRFLDDLGHPEQTYPAIHIAGTSGKGSTALLIAEGLKANNFRIGLHVTPYLQVATEKLWINSMYASMQEFIDLVEWIKPICEKWRAPDVPLHGMASFGICLEYFRRQKVDIAVIETGVGGRDDLTNVLNTKLSVITPLGLDHTKTLGGTIKEIAYHKAGIIKENGDAVALKGPGSSVIEKEAKIKNATLTWIDDNVIRSLKTNLTGYKKVNSAIAQIALQRICKDTSGELLFSGDCSLPGRMEIINNTSKIILDGAHNFQKLSALFEEIDFKNTIIIFGLLDSKSNDDIFKLISKIDTDFIFTEPEVFGKDAMSCNTLRKVTNKLSSLAIKDPKEALKKALSMSGRDKKILVTGSLYLVGNIREEFYPSREVLEQRTSWPKINQQQAQP